MSGSAVRSQCRRFSLGSAWCLTIAVLVFLIVGVCVSYHEFWRERFMMANGAAVRLNISVRQNQALARLEFTNPTSSDVFIEKYNACVDGEIENNVFQIQWDGHVVDYTGILAKRRRPLPEDYVKIPPGGTLTALVDLVRAYHFPAGSRIYDATYSAVISYPDREGIWTLTSNTERLRFGW